MLLASLIIINPWGILTWILSLFLFLVIIRYSYLAGLAATICVAILGTFFFIFSVTNWSSWAVMVHGWSCAIILVLRLIPEYQAMRRGEIERWKGLKSSQWTK